MNNTKDLIGVIGLGYVGYPLSLSLSQRFELVALDNNQKHVESLNTINHNFRISYNPDILSDVNIFIIAVPTPIIQESHTPDLKPLSEACKTISPYISKKTIICFESTVYPGTLKEICTPIIEKFSGLKRGPDFSLVYAPERISPGTKDYTLEKMPRIIAADNKESLEKMSNIYGSINGNQIHPVSSIEVAETAKLIENVQRDVNIALANDVAILCDRIGISSLEVIKAASSKPNFMPCSPGLVGGHCIGIDPYYLIHKAKSLNLSSSLSHTARMINENMPMHFANIIHSRINKKSNIIILGITFKPNTDDIRNSKVPQLIQSLQSLGHTCKVYDPIASHEKVLQQYNISLTKLNHQLYDAVVIAVPHKLFCDFNLNKILKPNGFVADIYGKWNNKKELHLSVPSMSYWKP